MKKLLILTLLISGLQAEPRKYNCCRTLFLDSIKAKNELFEIIERTKRGNEIHAQYQAGKISEEEKLSALDALRPLGDIARNKITKLTSQISKNCLTDAIFDRHFLERNYCLIDVNEECDITHYIIDTLNKEYLNPNNNPDKDVEMVSETSGFCSELEIGFWNKLIRRITGK